MPKGPNMNMSSTNPGTNRLALLILSLGLYVILTGGILTQLSARGVITLTSQRARELIDLPSVGSDIDESTDPIYNYTFDPSEEESHDIEGSSGEESRDIRGSLEAEYTCDAQNSPDFLPESDLIRRSLHSVIIGAMKGGTQALHKLLTEGHPRILTSSTGRGELHFFNNQGLKRQFGHSSRQNARSMMSQNIPRRDLRDGFELILRNRTAMARRKNGTLDITNDKNHGKIGTHSAPIYMFTGRSVPARMLCVAPWIKFFALLRNPIDRALSHYNFVHSWPNYENMSFREFIERDIRQLRKEGVLRDWTETNFTTFSGSAEEFEAWGRYAKKARNGGPVGRGLYAIQLEMWFQEFAKINKSIEEDFLALRSEEMKENPKDAYEQAVEFLGLKTRRARGFKRLVQKDHHKTDYIHKSIGDRTYNMLYELFKPYNDRLYKLLGEDVWGGVWDEEKHTTLKIL
ncbi:hypothetical protein ACHAWF_017355 [Thalassiosira exigua]